MTFYLSPHALAWSFDRCRRCWWLKLHNQFQSGEEVKKIFETMPKIFLQIDKGMKAAITPEVITSMGIGEVVSHSTNERVVSEPFCHAGAELTISGYPDFVGDLASEECLLLDYKTTDPSNRTTQVYTRQLHCYEFAMRNPQHTIPRQVDKMGLICFTPTEETFKVEVKDRVWGALYGPLTYIDFQIDRPWFEKFLETVAELLMTEEPPDFSSHCQVCFALSHSGGRR